MGVASIRFSDASRLPPESDFSRWPGVYVIPGKFKSVADKTRDPEAWERYRSRYQRLKAYYKARKSRYREKEGHVHANGERWCHQQSRFQR
jgi:hypothetical protein